LAWLGLLVIFEQSADMIYPRPSPFICPGFGIKPRISLVVFFSPILEKYIPRDTGKPDNQQIKRAQQNTLQAMPIFMPYQGGITQLLFADFTGYKNEYPQRDAAFEFYMLQDGICGDYGSFVAKMRFADKT